MEFTTENELEIGFIEYLKVYNNNLELINQTTKEYDDLICSIKSKVTVELARDLLVVLNSDPYVDVVYDGNFLGITKTTLSANIIFVSLEVGYLIRKYKFNEEDINAFYERLINQIAVNTLRNRNYFSGLDTKLTSDEVK